MPCATNVFLPGSLARLPSKGVGTVLAVLPDFGVVSVDFGAGPQPIAMGALVMPSFAERGSHLDRCQRRGGAKVFDLLPRLRRKILRVVR